ncbi:MAG: hypothetical protein HYV27_09015 [Candidatus Hydrogenedentes bacterium]|nr:hypothetical protein [Candidatus Hydrogenedentota bacterium]
MAFLVLVPHARSWWRTFALLEGIDRTLIRQMLHLCRFTGNLRILVISFAMIGFLVCIRTLGMPVPLVVVAMMASVVLVPLLRMTLPPTVLFLAGSGERGNALLIRLHFAVAPLRVVALLDPQRMGTVGQMLRLDLMRTSSENTWKSMVHRLIDIAPIYVVDTVHRTAPIRYEAFLMLAPERAGRTVFISDDNGVCPSLLAEGIDPSEHAIPVTKPGDMEHAVLRLLDMASTEPNRATCTQNRATVVAENWDSLPSVLMIGLVDGLDGHFLLAQARNTEKSLIALLVPLSSMDQNAANDSIELLWDFSRNPQLVGLYLETTGLAMVRREFLLENSELLDVHIAGVDPQNMSFEDLNKPEPVGDAVHQLCHEWRRAAQQRGLEFRFARK